MKPKPRVIFDTNIFLSGIFFGGNPQACLELARESSIQLFSSKTLLLELAQKLLKKFELDWTQVEDVIVGIKKYSTVIEPKTQFHVIKNDPPDNRILECAIDAKVDYIISGDKKHVLSLKKFKNIPIVSAKEFLDEFYGKKQNNE